MGDEDRCTLKDPRRTVPGGEVPVGTPQHTTFVVSEPPSESKPHPVKIEQKIRISLRPRSTYKFTTSVIHTAKCL